MERRPILYVRFFMTEAGTEPVRDWLRTLSPTDRKLIGENIKTVQFGWPLGMPLVDHLGGDIMVLLHAFIKKQQKTPKPDLDLAKDRLKQLRRRK